jgi:exopolysaccharide biosynthesis predicted pyruvyltransferase EpsI
MAKVQSERQLGHVLPHYNKINKDRRDIFCEWMSLSSVKLLEKIHFNQQSNQLQGTESFEKLTATQLVKTFPTFYRTWRFITVFTRACH